MRFRPFSALSADRQPRGLRRENAPAGDLQLRSRFVLLGMLFLFVLLAGRSLYLQVFREQFLQEQGDARYRRLIKTEANRGIITDRNGEPLAISTPVQSLWASAEQIEELKPEHYQALSKLLELPVSEIRKKLNDSGRDFIYLKRQLSPEVADKVMALKIPGIFKQQEFRRYYPAGEILAHVIGYTDVDDRGQEGLELTQDAILAGKPGSRHVIKDRRGAIVEDVSFVQKPQDGATLTLSIDRKIQYLAYRELKAAVELHRARAGGLIVLDARTGEVLALANYPSYNPNNRGKLDPSRKRNRVLTDMVEPGSTMKPFTVAAGLESGKYRPTTVVNTNGGSLTLGPATIRDAHPAPALSVEHIIQKSSNVGTSKIALSLEPAYMWRMFDAVGFGHPLQTGFPGESPGRVRPYKTWRPIEQATMSYGHGISVSLAQLAHGYMIFAGDGTIRPLSFLRLNTMPQGRQIISASTASSLRKMLELVVQPGGTAPRAQVVGYRVAGKTGTARKLESGNYSAQHHLSSFVGLAPASNPRLIVAVMIDEPNSGQYYGGTVAAPVFSKVIAGSLRMLGVEPDAPINSPIQYVDVPEIKEET